MPIAPEAPSAPKPILAPARPLSPHLQVYRPQLTSVLSITHRATGVALAVGTLLLVWWLIAAATGPEAFAVVQTFMGSWRGLALLPGWNASPSGGVVVVVVIAATFDHAQLGLQVVIEDYVHREGAKVALILFVKGAAIVLALAALFAVLRIYSWGG